MRKLTGFRYMRLHDRQRFMQLQRERGQKAGAIYRARFTGSGITTERMLQKLTQFATRIGHTPSIKEVDMASRDEVCCSPHYQQKFGSYNNAIVAAGLVPNKVSNNSDVLVDVNEDTKQVLFGSLLGDGSLTSRSGNARFRENHCIAQEEYLLWKAEKLLCFFPSMKYYVMDGKQMINLSTRNLPYLSEIRRLFYKPQKTVSTDILDNLNALAIAVWYMDDGTLHKLGYIRLATHSFGLRGNILMQEWFSKKFKIKSIIQCHNSNKYSVDRRFSLYFSKKESTKLLTIIRPYSHFCLQYKFLQNQ